VVLDDRVRPQPGVFVSDRAPASSGERGPGSRIAP
jgi:hypothetical protein